ncbi:MAG: alpha/beta hydrolase [Sulfitobacter sp.]|nr:alpha/beta hydrolase [Sulfitobacter sp.]
MPYATAKDGTRLHYFTYGNGPDVVLIHGWPLSHAMWEYQVQALVDAGNRVTAYCRRGFGHSDQPWEGYDYDTMSDDLAAVMEAAELRDVALVGFSMGGGEVARYMSRHEGRNVRAAALISAVPPFMMKTDDNPEGVDPQIFEDIKQGLRDDRPGFLTGFNQDFFGQGTDAGGVSEALLNEAVRVAMQASPKATLDCVDAFGKTDFRGDMAHFKVPTLIIHGTGDKTVPFEASAKRAAEMIEGAELKTYDGAPHALTMTHKDQFNSDLIAFLRS